MSLYYSNEGCEDCDECKPGFYSNQTASVECEPCQLGEHR